ncbi:hypothetical protein GLYMA_14G135001v4 [Glycine max]|uniref:serine/threonine-protein phosphatase BSL3 isoform X4 n=1 Tax=Glycine max TaxID=3847 RepID=UPI000719384E|nr:serine/threonine-protein phosphatase BSL3 isoform X4 [Glycine max]KAG4382670.1 hypothetical protein GLYMA_14G135001v4 [Glycine max]KAH1094355.1 hypothetical protein GYH30_039870 [Glycine max]|eukprot:XP_014622787.1 serine/threonine-protein phosphatase BSL3 [Glycine max]
MQYGYSGFWSDGSRGFMGGIGSAGLSAEDLHVLDLTQQWPHWHWFELVSVQGPGPRPCYGHVMALVGQRYLMAIGGNDGKRPLADVWALDTAAKPYEWHKLEPEGEGPPPCIADFLEGFIFGTTSSAHQHTKEDLQLEKSICL